MSKGRRGAVARYQQPQPAADEAAADDSAALGTAEVAHDATGTVSADPVLADIGRTGEYEDVPRAEGTTDAAAGADVQLVAAEFDTGYYVRQCCELPADADPVLHYLTRGWLDGLDPTPEFSTRFYLERSADVRSCGMNPYVHYLRWGRREGRAPNPRLIGREGAGEVQDVVGAEFDRDFYLLSHPELVRNSVDPLEHYLAFGSEMGWDPSPQFSTAFYLDRSPDVRSLGLNPFYHYLKWGRLEGRMPSAEALARGRPAYSAAAELLRPEFDAAYYLERQPDLMRTHVDPLLHYLHFGWRMGYDPSLRFSTQFYLDCSPDLRGSDENPLHHYIRVGRAQGRLPKRPACLADAGEVDLLESATVRSEIARFFDEQYYKDRYADVTANRLDALLHYISAGWREHRDPAAWFSTSYYLSRYPGVEIIGINPLFHYVVWGKEQGFSTYLADYGGVRATVVPGKQLVASRDLRTTLRRPVVADLASVTAPRDGTALDIHWVIPDFNAGGGGHMTIFRMVKWLELLGHQCTIWVQWPSFDRTDAQRAEILLKNYQAVRAEVRTLPSEPEFPGADAVIATSWDSAYLVRGITGARAKFYFVQDYEPFFYPAGARSLAARETYGFGLPCICASPWLERLMRQHGSATYAFRLAADEVYRPPDARPRNAVPRIAFYARDHTTRRAVELGLLALEVLAARGEPFHVDLFGSDTRFDETPFPATNWGIADPAVLAKLYGEADLGVCFSATNYSLVPQEMMACGLPVVELATESTREAFPDGVVALAPPDPYAIADTIAALLHDNPMRDALAGRGAAWAGGLSWEASARVVEGALRQTLGMPASPNVRRPVQPPKATVLIPTHNGGALFRRVLTAVLAQRSPWPFEVVVIDTASRDGTWDYVQEHGGRVRALQIDKTEFQHGRTRNLGASMANGEFLALLTQDALPTDPFWLYNLVVTLERYPKAAGAFGRHLPWPDASPFTIRDIENHFALFQREPLYVSKYTDLERWRGGDLGFRRFLHYFSDNNACLRRSVWERHPYPEIDYGEDQVWAYNIISLGYGKLYVPKAAVYHSHDYDERQTFERARTEAAFFLAQFGYDVAPANLKEAISNRNADDERWGVRNGVGAEAIALQKRLNVHKLSGLAAGATQGVAFASAF